CSSFLLASALSTVPPCHAGDGSERGALRPLHVCPAERAADEAGLKRPTGYLHSSQEVLMFVTRKIVRTFAIALTAVGLAFGSFSVTGAFDANPLLADVGGQRGDWDVG